MYYTDYFSKQYRLIKNLNIFATHKTIDDTILVNSSIRALLCMPMAASIRMNSMLHLHAVTYILALESVTLFFQPSKFAFNCILFHFSSNFLLHPKMKSPIITFLKALPQNLIIQFRMKDFLLLKTIKLFQNFTS